MDSGNADTVRRPVRRSSAGLGCLRRRARGELPAGPAPLHRLGRLRKTRPARAPGRPLHPQRHVPASPSGQRRPQPRGGRGALHPGGPGQSVLSGRDRPASGGRARPLGLRVLSGQRHPRLGEHRRGAGLRSSDVGEGPTRPHELFRHRVAAPARRAPHRAHLHDRAGGIAGPRAQPAAQPLFSAMPRPLSDSWTPRRPT